MANIGRVKAFNSHKTTLMISGEWSAECDAEIKRGGFDRLTLAGAEYADFSCLVQHARDITALSIGVRSRSAAGLDLLGNLQSLSVGCGQGKDFNFSTLKALRHLNIDSWMPSYSATLFKLKFLESLRIEGYNGTDCSEIGKLGELRSLQLAKGSITTLKGLNNCSRLSAVDFAYLRRLNDISELALIPTLREVELSEGLASLHSIDVVTRLTELEQLDVSQVGLELEDINWLYGFANLRSISLPIVRKINWGALFHSQLLERVQIRSSELAATSLENILEVARQHRHTPTDSTPFGTKRIPGYAIKFKIKNNG